MAAVSLQARRGLQVGIPDDKHYQDGELWVGMCVGRPATDVYYINAYFRKETDTRKLLVNVLGKKLEKW
jgi:hypothetical protein